MIIEFKKEREKKEDERVEKEVLLVRPQKL